MAHLWLDQGREEIFNPQFLRKGLTEGRSFPDSHHLKTFPEEKEGKILKLPEREAFPPLFLTNSVYLY